MSEYRVLTLKLANYLTDKGFTYTRKIQDVDKPHFFNWMFKKTPELIAAIEEYKELKTREGERSD